MSKAKEVVPEGSVSIESVWHQDGFDPFAGTPEVATWRDIAPEPEADKPAARKALAGKPDVKEG